MSQVNLPPQIQQNQTDTEKMVGLLTLLFQTVSRMADDLSEVKATLKELAEKQKQSGEGHHKNP
jgi:hypothetical protein